MSDQLVVRSPDPVKERVVSMLIANAEWLQWFIDEQLDDMPALVAMPLITLAKRRFGLPRDELWKTVPAAVNACDDASFTRVVSLLREILAETPAEAPNA